MQRVLAFISLVLLSVSTIQSQDRPDSTKRIGVAAIPIIDYDPTFSLRVGTVGQLFYKLNEKDTISPSSSTGIMGFYSFNGSLFVSAFQKLYLAEDRWRIRAEPQMLCDRPACFQSTTA